MRKFGIAAMLAVLFSALPAGAASASAQMPVPLSLEARLGATIPRGAVAERWGTGLGYGVEAAAWIDPRVALYAGYSRSFFDLDALDDVRARDSGYALGLRARLPLPGSGEARVAPWMGAGLLVHTMEIRGTTLPRDDRRPGFEIGTGLALRASPAPIAGLSLVPGSSWGLHYRRYQARVLAPDREAVSYFSLGGAINVSF